MDLSSLHLGAPLWAWALLAVPAIVALWAWRSLKTRRALAAFSRPAALSRRRWIAAAIPTSLAAACTILALMRPQLDPMVHEVTLRGRDVVFLVDVSRSMLAQDVAPSRLERTKLWIKDLTAGLKGDRVALVAFAGAAVVKCPLTVDYDFFRLSLEELSPASVPRGGTLIGDAIRKTLSQVFDQSAGRFRDIVLISDGEDQESFPAQAAEQAREQNVRIIALGIGSEIGGAPVPAANTESGAAPQSAAENGHRSKLDATTLAQVAAASAGGVFLNVGTGTIDLEQVYQDLIASAEKSDLGSKTSVTYKERFQILIALALAVTILEALAYARPR